MKEKIISILLAAVMVLSVVPFMSLATLAASSSTATDGNGNQIGTDDKVTYDSTWYDSAATDLYIWDESDFIAYGLQIQNSGANSTMYKNQVIHIMNDLDFSTLDLANIQGNKVSGTAKNWFNVIVIARTFHEVDGVRVYDDIMVYTFDTANS